MWIDPDPSNAARVWEALVPFGAPVGSMGVTPEDLVRPDLVVQMGLPPRRVDLLTGLTGVTFGEAWPERVIHRVGAFDVPFLGRATLLRNKRATSRAKDLADVEAIEPGG